MTNLSNSPVLENAGFVIISDDTEAFLKELPDNDIPVWTTNYKEAMRVYNSKLKHKLEKTGIPLRYCILLAHSQEI